MSTYSFDSEGLHVVFADDEELDRLSLGCSDVIGEALDDLAEMKIGVLRVESCLLSDKQFHA